MTNPRLAHSRGRECSCTVGWYLHAHGDQEVAVFWVEWELHKVFQKTEEKNNLKANASDPIHQTALPSSTK